MCGHGYFTNTTAGVDGDEARLRRERFGLWTLNVLKTSLLIDARETSPSNRCIPAWRGQIQDGSILLSPPSTHQQSSIFVVSQLCEFKLQETESCFTSLGCLRRNCARFKKCKASLPGCGIISSRRLSPSPLFLALSLSVTRECNLVFNSVTDARS